MAHATSGGYETAWFPGFLSITNNNYATATGTITINNGGTPLNRNFSIAAGASLRVEYNGNSQSASTTNSVSMRSVMNPSSRDGLPMDYGIHITSNIPVSAYFMLSNTWTMEIYTLKGHKALGTLFYVPMQSDNYTLTEISLDQIDIVATENNTTVTMTTTGATRLVDAGGSNYTSRPAGTFSVTMQRGQTFKLEEYAANQTPTLAGTKIESDYPIAVTVSEDYVARDASGDQLVPVNYLGTVHVVPHGYGGADERIYIFATQPNTNVKLQSGGESSAGAVENRSIAAAGGVTVWTNPPNDHNSTYIEASKPVYVYHRSGIGQPSEFNNLGASIVAPIYSTKQTRLRLSLPGSSSANRQYGYIVFRDGDENSFMILYGNGTGAGNLLTLTPLQIPGVPEWKLAKFDFTIAANARNATITSSAGAFSLANIGGYYDRTGYYGYFTSFGPFEFPDITYMCGPSVTLVGGFADEYLWTLPGGSTVSGVNSLDATEEGIYTLRMIQNGSFGTPDTVYASTDVVKVNAGVIDRPAVLMCATNADPGLLSVTGSVSPTNPTYQWQRSTNKTTWTDLTTATATTATLNLNVGSIKPTNAQRTYYYRRGISSDECGMIYTDPAMVTLDASGGAPSPFSQTVCNGTPAIPLTLTGATDPVTYQWQSSPDATNWTPISGATSATYTPVNPNTSLYSHTMFYRCEITTTCGGAAVNSTAATVNFSPCMIPVNPHLMSKIIVQP
jgi:hypothetical protein